MALGVGGWREAGWSERGWGGELDWMRETGGRQMDGRKDEELGGRVNLSRVRAFFYVVSISRRPYPVSNVQSKAKSPK